MSKIYVIGSSNTDMVVQCRSLPKPGETVLGGTFVSVHGGKGANQAVAAARLQGNVTFFCRVGIDSLGQDSIAAYLREGIDTSHITQDASEKSGVALIVVDSQGENYIAVAPGVNSNLCSQDVELLNNLLQPGDVVLMQLEIPLETVQYAAAIGREKGATVILDPAPAPSEKLPGELLRNLDYILPNEHEAKVLADSELALEELTTSLLQLGVKNAIVHAGTQGCVWASAEVTLSIPAFRVQAVDSTAAGDAFAGAFAVALAEGRDVPDAIEWAQRAAAISVTRMGAQTSLPTRQEVDGFHIG